jgi:hypothetical protein
MSAPWRGTFAAETDAWRGQLGRLGFGDDGVRLRGEVEWHHPTHGLVRARIEVEPDDRFPFAPPSVRVIDPGTDLKLTFHIERPSRSGSSGNLCLWDSNSYPVDDAPWRDPQVFLDRVRGWLEQTAAGWPGDNVCDLERYLNTDTTTLVLYDADVLTNVAGVVKTAAGPSPSTILVTDRRRNAVIAPRRRGRLHPKDRALAWVDDLGEIDAPLAEWSDIAAKLGANAHEVTRLVKIGAVGLLLLRYTRSGNPGTLAVTAKPGVPVPTVAACESADTSPTTRAMRAGDLATDLADVRIAVIGVGAVGSFAADLLYRSGVRCLTLIDFERLRPGNVVRHLGTVDDVGEYKVNVTKKCLAKIGFPTDKIVTKVDAVTRFTDAIDLVKMHDVVLDATANARASSLLSAAADIAGPGTGHAVISACVQREGHVLRADRFPLRRGERHLPALPEEPVHDNIREAGCGDPVSRTPPPSVVAAADLAWQMAVDHATRQCELPASLAVIRRPQLEAPFDRLGVITSGAVEPSAS